MDWIGQYKIGEKIGGGAYGTVYKGWDNEKKGTVALKRTRTTGMGNMPSPVVREIPILEQLQHENIVRYRGVQPHMVYLYLVFDYMDMDLNKYMKTYPQFAEEPGKIKTFLHQILSGVAFCHSRNIIHRDLKPENLLIDSSTDIIKLTDFGLARKFSDTDFGLTPKLGTLWYRSPEVLLGSSHYSTPTDVWSVGCIFAEMVNLKPLFSETTSIQQLQKIYSLLGTPNEDTWPGVTSLPDYFPFENATPKDLAIEVPSLKPDGVDLLSKMLCLNPNNRIGAQGALEHEYFKIQE